MPSNATRVKVFTSLDEPGHKGVQRVLEGVVNSKCIAVVGAGISVEAQIPDYRSSDGMAHLSFSVLGQKFKGKEIFMATEGPKANQLVALNYLMTTFRQHARTVPLTHFHRLITTMLDTGRAIKCLTRNFDSLETRDRPDLTSKVIELHGNNNSLSCPAGHMPIGPKDIAAYDNDFLKGIETTSRKRSDKDKRLRIINTVYNLRPAVYLDERLVPDLHDGKVRAEILSQASSCQVLLVAGTSLATPQVFQLVMDLADRVHAAEGVVVFINTKDMSKGRIGHSIDFYLKIDAQDCAQFMLNMIAQQESFDVQHGKDIWLEFAERDLPGVTTQAMPPLSIPVCFQCAHPLEEVLHPCAVCNRLYCFESPRHNLGRMCVVLDMFTPTPLVPFEERIKGFVCPDCYPYEEGKLYPHLVRAPRFLYEPPEAPKRLRLVMYYLGQFWTLSEHIEGIIVSAWTSEGWACSTTQTRLQSLHESPNTVADCIYEPKTYELLVVYVTHGVSAHGLYQIGDNIALRAREFLEITTRPIQYLITGSRFSAAVFLTCGQVYQVGENALQLKEWMDCPDTYDSIVGMLNERLAPAYLASFLAKAATDLLGYRHWDNRTVLDIWLRDTLACTHTDLVYLGKSEESEASEKSGVAKLFMFSPMHSRPLGRPLPSILMTCLCKPRENGGSKKKCWVVKHRGHNGMALDQVEINLKCSLCRKGYNLRAHDHQGKLVKIGGLYAAVVPYFLK